MQPTESRMTCNADQENIYGIWYTTGPIFESFAYHMISFHINGDCLIHQKRVPDMSTLLDKNISRKMTILVISYYPQMGNPCYNFHCYYRSLTSLFTIRSERDDWGTTWSNRNSFFKVLKPEWDLFNRE